MTHSKDDRLVTLDELASVLGAHEGPPRIIQESAPESPRRPGRFRLRWVGAAVAVALLAGSGLGFGLATSLTPRGSAGTNVVGFGFLPARGWTVVQSGVISQAGAAIAIAANVPLHPRDDVTSVPYSTLEALPANGVLILTTFTLRGDPGEDFTFPVSGSPLQLGSAQHLSPASDPLPFPRQLGQHRLRAGVGGYNVDTRIYFGTVVPAASMLAAAQRQLNRLVVASERVTIALRPSIVSTSTGAVTVFGSVDSSQAGESVTVQAKDCGNRFFRVFAGASTTDGGSWSTLIFPRITTTLRAVWGKETSAEVTLRKRVGVGLRQLTATRFRATVGGQANFWHKRILIQRFDQRLGTWGTFKSILITESGGGQVKIERFTLSVPKGTLLRAVFPLSQARPCYLSGTSPTIRT